MLNSLTVARKWASQIHKLSEHYQQIDKINKKFDYSSMPNMMSETILYNNQNT